MSDQQSGSRSGPLTRRRLLLGGAAAAGAAGAGVLIDRVSAGEHPAHPAQAPPAPIALGSQPPGLPARQHAWADTERVDDDGNRVAPQFDRLLFFDVRGQPGTAHADVLEAALRTLERRFRWGPGGLLFTMGWGPDYFQHVVHAPSPIPQAQALSDFELPTIDDYHACLHLACDDQERLDQIESALVHGAELPGASGQLAIADALVWRETRTGFTGAGLPAHYQRTGGIPAGNPVPKSSPLFMGFKSNLRKNQATEDAVTIPDGPFAGGTTMQVSLMRLRLDSWYRDLSHRERVARMYAPQVSPEEAAHFTTDAESDPQLLHQAINRYGVIGHSQTSATARRHNQPLILRRDFNTVDGGQAGLHFVSVQRTIEDFVTTRNAMNATTAQLQNPAITDTVNNGINEFIFVLRRANYVLPTRAQRSFPLLRS